MLSPLQLQSIVDGECTPSERREWLALCDQSPDDWRILALSLLEEQQFARRLAKLQRSSPDNVVNATGNSNSQSVSLASIATAVTGEPIARSSAAASANERVGSWRPVLAASVLVATGFLSSWILNGWIGMSSLPIDNSHVAIQKNNGQGASDLNVLSQPLNSTRTGNDNRMLVSDRDYRSDLPEADLRVQVPGVGRDSYEIPIYDARDVDPMLVLAQQEYEMQRANQKLKRSGFELDMRPEYVTGVLPDGRQVVVPLHQVGLKPYGQ